jgi:hypothetical protein
MAFQFTILPVIAAVRQAVVTSLSQQGQVPYAVPLTTTARQVAEHPGDLPLTLIQAHACKVTDEAGVSSVQLSLPLTIHHLRDTQPGAGSGTETALQLLSGLAASIRADYRLVAAQGGLNALNIEEAVVNSIDCGDDNIVQMLLDQANQTDQVAVSLSLTVTWTEDLF